MGNQTLLLMEYLLSLAWRKEWHVLISIFFYLLCSLKVPMRGFKVIYFLVAQTKHVIFIINKKTLSWIQFLLLTAQVSDEEEENVSKASSCILKKLMHLYFANLCLVWAFPILQLNKGFLWGQNNMTGTKKVTSEKHRRWWADSWTLENTKSGSQVPPTDQNPTHQEQGNRSLKFLPS